MEAFIHKLRQHNIDIDIVDDQLKLNIPEGVDVAHILNEARENKEKLISFIKKFKNAADFRIIEPAPVNDYYVLSPSQRRLYFLYEFDKTSVSYNMPRAIKLDGVLDKEKLRSTFRQLLARHESLRTSFHVINEVPVQKISDQIDFELEYFESTEDRVWTVLKDFTRPFDLSCQPLLRAGLIVRAGLSGKTPEEYILMVDMHHIITDGVSIDVLIQDFKALYNNERLADLKLQYKDYSEWLQRAEQQTSIARQKEFWLKEFSEEATDLDLPGDFIRPSIKNSAGSSVNFVINAEETLRLKLIAQSENTTMFMMILSIYNILLSKLSNQEVITIGTPMAGRQHADLERIIGMFVNTLPLRNFPRPDLKFRDFLSLLTSRTLACIDNQSYPYEALISELEIVRDASRNPLFEVFFQYQAAVEDAAESIRGLMSQSLDTGHNISKFDMTLSAVEQGDELQLNFLYSTEIFRRETIGRYVLYFKKIVSEVITDLDRRICDIEIMPEEERRRILEFNGERADYERQKTIIDLFEDQVSRTPEKTAAIFRNSGICYKELSEKVNGLVRLMREHGVEKGGRVVVLIDHSFELLVSLLSVMKCGCAFVPVDVNWPSQRKEEVLASLEPMLVLCSSKDEVESLTVENYLAVSYAAIDPVAETAGAVIDSEDPIYIIYTSGSTSIPKGVEVPYRGIMNRLFWMNDFFGRDTAESVLQTTRYVYDSAVWQLFWPLINGGQTIMLPPDFEMTSGAISDLISDHKIRLTDFVPSVFNTIFEYSKDPDHEIYGKLRSLRYIIQGGEEISERITRQFLNHYPSIDIVNLYGPTEASIGCVYHLVERTATGKIPIGRPIPNVHIWILDKYLHVVPIGVIGELCISGSCLATGYFNNPEQTEAKFVFNDSIHERIYRTGDLARWLPDGNIEFLGRMDTQVKIRGFRIEPGEISSQLSGHDKIRESVVVAQEAEGNKYLVGYYVSEEELDPSEIRRFLLEKLPDYMIPSYYVRLERIPLTPNGKVDRRGLPSPQTGGAGYTGPANAVEVKLVELWSEILKVVPEEISVTRSFFELGGHSLRAMVLVNRLSKEFSVRVPLKEIFRHQDIRSLGKYITGTEKSAYFSIERAKLKDYYFLSPAQKRLYFLYEFERTSLAYNMPQVLVLEGVLDKSRLSGAFRDLISRHESLRTSFHMIEGVPVQKVSEELDFSVAYIESFAEGVQEIIEGFIRPFDLSRSPLLRVGVISRAGEAEGVASSHILMVDMHHIITDGVSQGVLVKDFMSLYHGAALPALELQYKDYAKWQQSAEQQGIILRQKEFWLKTFMEEPLVLDLPGDFARPKQKDHSGDVLSFSIGREETGRLRSIAQEEGSTLFMVLLSVYNILLSKLSNQEDILIGTPVAGRGHADLEKMIGMFVNTLVLRNSVKGDHSMREFLASLTSLTLSCFENQDYPYEELIEELKVVRDTSRNPLFDVMFVFQNFESSALSMDGLKLKPYSHGHIVSKFDITLSAAERGDELQLSFLYSTEIFRRETIGRYVLYFKKIVSEVITDLDRRICDIEIMPEEERRRILEFNDARADYKRQKTIIDLFEDQVSRAPEKTAVIFKNSGICYKELSEKVNGLVRLMREQGVEKGGRVVVLIDHSFELLVSLLSVMKCGCAFVPVDVNWPSQRKEEILASLEPMLVLCSSKDEVEPLTVENYLAVSYAAIDRVAETAGAVIDPEDPIYIIYTSGSTGIPKGVEVPYRGIMNRLFWMNDFFGRDTAESVLQTTRYVYDSAVWQLFWPLINGGQTIMLPPDFEMTSGAISDLISDHKIRLTDFVPSVFNTIFEYSKDPDHEIYGKLRSLRYIIQGGEEISERITRQFLNHYPSIDIVNLYGPTEASIGCVYHLVERTATGKIPIGRPIPNVHIWILDKYLHVAPIGVIGELCISGSCLATGYFNNPEQTEAKFVFNDSIHERIYRTGDLARWLPDGNIEFLGRMDTQVKIRGFRIEPGEISSQLSGHDKIRESVVIAREEEGNKYLVGYYVSEEELEPSEIRRFLSEKLPDYMIPSYYVRLERIPLTLNGKVDRKRLPSPQTGGAGYTGPANAVEVKLVALWSEILKVVPEEISVTRSFFELGGHSLRAMVLVNRLSKEFSVRVPLKEIFRHQDIRSLGKYITGTEKSAYFSIERAKLKDYYFLSPAQKRLYFLYEFERTSVAYNMPQVLVLEGVLDKSRLSGAFRDLISRHESLRTSFHMIEGVPVQKVSEELDFSVAYIESFAEGVQEIIEGFIRPFDLSRSPLLRVGVISRAGDAEGIASSHILMVDMHHIITDGVSQGVLVKDFMSLYHGAALPVLELQYKDYAEWQQNAEQQGIILRQKEFWLKTFMEEPLVLDLPGDFARPKQKDHSGDVLSFSIGREETGRLRSIAQEEGSTLFMVLLSVYNILLSKLSNQEDILIGTPVAGRGHADLEKMIGMFVNTLVLRNSVKGDQSMREFLASLTSLTLSCFENQDYPYEELIEELKVVRDTSRNPLFDVMFVFQNFESSTLSMDGLKLKPYSHGHTVSKFDMTLSVVEQGDELQLSFLYSTEIFRRETIGRYVLYFKKIVSEVITDLDRRICDIEMMPAEEKHRLLYSFNATRVDYPRDKTLMDLFEDQVARTPDHIALIYEGTMLTYEELNKRANQIAHVLRKQNIQVDECVGILGRPSIDSIISMLGILKAGGAYLPLDAEYPAERLQYMISDSKVRIVLCRKDYIFLLKDDIIIIDTGYAGKQEPVIGIERSGTSSDLCYVMYTSGSTGKPKGVSITHRNVVRLVRNTNYVVLDASTRILQTGAPAFDATTFEIWGSLLNGGVLYLVGKELLLDTTLLGKALVEYEINTLWLTSSLFDQHALNDAGIFRPLRYLLVGGDVLNPNLINLVRDKNPHVQIINGYGPTENTTFSVCFPITHNLTTNIPIGKPISNSTAYILDTHGKLQPIGAVGELCVGGDGVGRGYLNNESLTRERFISNPFSPGEQMYRTGDLARWLPDGNIEFLGRMDTQVKIRGFRIEPGEISSQLSGHDKIRESVVIAREEEGNKYLVGYYVSEEELEPSEIRRFLSEKLPDYMIPSYYVRLERIPLTLNGKVDRKRLPSPQTGGAGYTGPVNAVEERLVALWSEILKVVPEEISVTRSFFELGGHSLRAMVLVNRLSKEFSVRVPLKEIFRHQDIRSLGKYITGTEKSAYFSIERAKLKDYYFLSPAQKRLYFLYEFERTSVAYNMPQVLVLEGVLDKSRLSGAFRDLISRHESLRTSFHMIEGVPVQKVSEELDFSVAYIESFAEGVQEIIEGFIRPFDLSRSPLLRVGVISRAGEAEGVASSHILMVDMHHIITDGVSQGVLVKDFMSLYHGAALPALDLQYKDYAEWQQHAEQQGIILRQKEFWLKTFKEEPLVLDLPGDFVRPKQKDHSGDVLSFSIGREETGRLRSIAKEEGSTLFMVLLSVYNILLSKLSNQEDILIGTPVAGRGHADLEKMIGMFVNTLVLRNSVKGEQSMREFLVSLTSMTLSCFENQDYPYEELIEELKVVRDTSRNPLFDVMFVFQNFESSTLSMDGLKLKPYSHGHTVSKFDITLSAAEQGDELQLSFVYSTEIFRRETIGRYVLYFKKIVSEVIADLDRRICDIEMMPAEEKHRLLYSFNATRVDYPRDSTVMDLFEDQVARTPDHIALIYEGTVLTYEELNDRSTRLGCYLKRKGVGRGSIVGLMIERSAEMIIGIAGILKSGGSYLPLESSQPADRVRYMLSESGAALLITAGENKEVYGKHIETLDVYADEIYQEHKIDHPGSRLSSDVAYIIYTSGSTGKPKGVMVKHQSVINLINSQKVLFGIDGSDRILQFTTICFDASVEQIWLALLNGLPLVLISKSVIADPVKFNDYLSRHRVTHLHATPSFLESLELTEPNSLRRIVSGGEECKVQLAERFCEAYQFYNEYGPTETTVTSIAGLVPGKNHGGRVALGRPVNNTRLYILGKEQELLPEGVKGELYIGGEGLAKGYIGDAGLTAERFILNPFSPGELMYRTGDLARWLPDGSIEFLGRVDAQVKIRGFRIEPGEISSQLSGHDKIRESVVVAQEAEGNKYLVGYYVSEEELEPSEIRRFLSEKLPDYMIPSYYVRLERIPLTPNGKVDRRGLPSPQTGGAGYTGPANAVEVKLVELWSEILKVVPEEISVTRSFFELGGHSLKAMKLVFSMQKEFQSQISLVDVFRSPTIRELSSKIQFKNHPVATDDLLTLLKQDPQGGNNLFFIHDGSGDVQGYMELSRLIKNYHCWGIRSMTLNHYGPQNVTLQEIVKQYINILKTLQPVGPYRIAGWSFGGIIAYEISRALELAGDTVDIVLMIDSKFTTTTRSKKHKQKTEFSLIEEKLLVARLLEVEPVTLEKLNTIDEVWKQAILLLKEKEVDLTKIKNEIPEGILSLIPHFDQIGVEDQVIYINTIRTLRNAMTGYSPAGKLKTQLVYIKASKTDLDTKQIPDHFRKKMIFEEIQGDHFTILKTPQVHELVKVVQENLNRSATQ